MERAAKGNSEDSYQDENSKTLPIHLFQVHKQYVCASVSQVTLGSAMEAGFESIF